MKNILLTSLFTSLLFSANFSMANSKIEAEQILPKTSVVASEKDKAQDKTTLPTNPSAAPLQNKEVIDEMVQSKLNTQIIHLASIDTTESKKKKSKDLGYDSYAFE